MKILTEAEWQILAEAHQQRLAFFTVPHRKRQEYGIKHPIYDFVTTYYSFPMRSLQWWQPGLDITLQGEAAEEFLHEPNYIKTTHGITLNPEGFPRHRLQSLKWLIELLKNTSERQPRFGCFGLHEWAMVYRSSDIRHTQLPLRLPPDELNAFVESQHLCCTHYDAFRFFTPLARPLNTIQLTKNSLHENEQPGCVHANMDLYKWAYKFYPWIGSDIIADCFILALKARELDMRASPYDCSSLGFTAIPVETPEGKAEYISQQRAITEEAIPLRKQLLSALEKIDFIQ